MEPISRDIFYKEYSNSGMFISFSLKEIKEISSVCEKLGLSNISHTEQKKYRRSAQEGFETYQFNYGEEKIGWEKPNAEGLVKGRLGGDINSYDLFPGYKILIEESKLKKYVKDKKNTILCIDYFSSPSGNVKGGIYLGLLKTRRGVFGIAYTGDSRPRYGNLNNNKYFVCNNTSEIIDIINKEILSSKDKVKSLNTDRVLKWSKSS
jgi:hypothetical protein